MPEPTSAAVYVVHVQGPDDVLPQPDRASACRVAHAINASIVALGPEALNDEYAPTQWAVVKRVGQRACGSSLGFGVGAGHECVCERPIGHPEDSDRPHGCVCGSMWSSQPERPMCRPCVIAGAPGATTPCPIHDRTHDTLATPPAQSTGDADA